MTSEQPASISSCPPDPSALTTLLNTTTLSKTPENALAVEIHHNLQYQHSWADLQLHVPRPSTSSIPTPTRSNEPLHLSSSPMPSMPLPVPMISGRPSTPLYIHPDVQAYMVKNRIKEADVPIEIEWVLPMSIGEKWTLRRFAEIFDSLPERDPLEWMHTTGPETTGTGGSAPRQHQDAKRVLLAMLSHAGMGGDGTITYYVLQQGDVKPRQN